jgi:hypothetical protein
MGPGGSYRIVFDPPPTSDLQRDDAQRVEGNVSYEDLAGILWDTPFWIHSSRGSSELQIAVEPPKRIGPVDSLLHRGPQSHS